MTIIYQVKSRLQCGLATTVNGVKGMSLNYCDPSATTKNCLYLSTAWQATKIKKLRLLPLALHWMDGQTLWCLVSLSSHCTLELLFRNTRGLPHSYSNDCTVRATLSGLSLCLASVCVLSFRHCAWLDAMICWSVHWHFMCTPLPSRRRKVTQR